MSVLSGLIYRNIIWREKEPGSSFPKAVVWQLQEDKNGMKYITETWKIFFSMSLEVDN